MNEIKDKINNNNLIATRADKGRTVVIMQKHDYELKISEFIDDHLAETNIDPTKQYQKKHEEHNQ
jgi:hypothetical protein